MIVAVWQPAGQKGRLPAVSLAQDELIRGGYGFMTQRAVIDALAWTAAVTNGVTEPDCAGVL
jgi:hypothetical protein